MKFDLQSNFSNQIKANFIKLKFISLQTDNKHLTETFNENINQDSTRVLIKQSDTNSRLLVNFHTG